MTRTDTHLDAMLRHLGAAYYDSLHGLATGADVTRAVDTVAEHLGGQEQPASAGTETAGAGRSRQHQAGQLRGGPRTPSGWSRRVSDVMTTSVVTVDRGTPYKEIARLLAQQRVSGLPVLKMGREVTGVVTEADLLAWHTRLARHLRAAGRRTAWLKSRQQTVLTAGELMTSPAITISPEATVPAAARLMNSRHIRLLPVVDKHGKLVGVVSRRDLLTVFLRPDEDVAADVRQVLSEILHAAPDEAEVAVRDGIVTLTGTLDPHANAHGDLIPVAIRLMGDVDGVVDVIDRLGQPLPAAHPVVPPPAPAS
ncbi:MAG: CBS domain-containing protein [Trebonia sp.]